MCHFGGKISDVDSLRGGDDARSFDRCAKLPHVTRPIVLLHRLHGSRSESGQPSILHWRELSQEVGRQQLDIVASFAERGDSHDRDIQPIPKIFTEALVFHHGFDISVGRRDQTNIDSPLRRFA